jgi:hypothetical protein
MTMANGFWVDEPMPVDKAAGYRPRQATCFQRNLFAVGRSDEQIADLIRSAAELRLHANDQIKKFFALDHLRGGLDRREFYRVGGGRT